MNIVLRYFSHQRITHAVLRIEPEVRRGLRAARQRDQQVLRNIALREAGLHRLGPVYVDVDRGFVAGLLNTCIDQATNGPQLRQQVVRHYAVLVELVADDLDVDRSREAEVQDLADDIRREECEGGAGKRRGQTIAQSRDV